MVSTKSCIFVSIPSSGKCVDLFVDVDLVLLLVGNRFWWVFPVVVGLRIFFCREMDGLDNLLLNLDEPATETLLHSLIEPQLRTFKSMEQTFHVYDHAHEGTLERSVQFLYDSARLVLQRQAELQQRNDLLGVPVKKVIVAAAPKAAAADGKRRKFGD